MTHPGGNGAGAWVASFAAQRAPGATGRRLDLLAAPPDWSPSLSESPNSRVLFDGVLYNRAELQAQLIAAGAGAATDAALVGRAYERWGEDAIRRLKGIFSVVISDPSRDVLLCARDALGIRPLFYTQLDRAVLLSPAVETLLAQPGVSAELNRACLIDRLTARWPANQETYFARVHRVPPGHVMRISGADRRVYRYWSPLPAGEPVAWLADDEAQGRFEALLAQAVQRCMDSAPTAVYVSGGLDSSTLAMVAADLSRDHGRIAPHALSLVFAEVGADEPARQRALATELGMPHLQRPFAEAVGSQGTLAAALAMTRTMPAPLSVIWRPALQHLGLHARTHGCGVILAGDGADEWLWENPIIAADFIRSFDLAGVYRLCRSYVRSYHFSRSEALRLVLWRHAARCLWPDLYDGVATRFGARDAPRRRAHWAAARAITVAPWLAPDPSLRAAAIERLEASAVRDRIESQADSYYVRDTRGRLESADKWYREEETFLIGRRTGIPTREPFWDPDLIELLVRVRPRVRSADGLAKALVRRPLTKRFPHLGFETQRKSWLGASFLSVLENETGAARRAMGGCTTLAALGVVDRERTDALLDDVLAASNRHRLGWAWELLNLEAWARAHT